MNTEGDLVFADVDAGETYAQARHVLDEGKRVAFSGVAAEAAKRRNVALAIAAVWIVVSAALIVALGPDTLVIAEIGAALVIAFAVFRLLPMGMARSELEELFGQYANQIDKLEASGAAFPECTSMEELTEALDKASENVD